MAILIPYRLGWGQFPWDGTPTPETDYVLDRLSWWQSEKGLYPYSGDEFRA
jgi:hypothetical protein